MPNDDGKALGLVKVGTKGQIVIPKTVRALFDIKPGDSLIVLGDIKQGIAIARTDKVVNMEELLKEMRDRNGSN